MKKDISIYFLGKLIPMLVNLSIVVLGVRLLGKQEYGQFSLIFSAITTFYTLFWGWIQQGILRYYSNKELVKNPNSFFLTLTLTMAFALAICMSLLSLLYFKISFFNSVLVGSTSFFYTLLFHVLVINQSKINSKNYVITEASFYLLWFIGCLFFVACMVYKYWIGFAAMLPALVVVIVAYYFFTKEKFETDFSTDFFKENKIQLKTVLNYGLPITIWLFLSNLFNYTDRFIIKNFFDYSQAGTYAAVYDLVFKVATFACMPILLSNHSRIVNSWNDKNYNHAFLIIRKSIYIELLMMLPAIIGTIIIGPYLLITVTKIDLPNALWIMLPILISSFVWQISMFIHKPLELHLKPWMMIIAMLIALLSNIILNYIFIPIYKFEAAAFNTLISTFVYTIMVFVFIRFNKLHQHIVVKES